MNSNQPLKFAPGDICIANYLDDKVRLVIIIQSEITERKYKVVPLSSLVKEQYSSVNRLQLNVVLNGKNNNVVALCDRTIYLVESLISTKVGYVDCDVIAQINGLVNGKPVCGVTQFHTEKQNLHVDQNQQSLFETVLHIDDSVSDLLSRSTMILNLLVSILTGLITSSILIVSSNNIRLILAICIIIAVISIAILIYKHNVKTAGKGKTLGDKKIVSHEKLPDEYITPNPYNIPIHDQGNKSNCTSQVIAEGIEYYLSNKFKQLVLVDVDDLWEKQKKYGTAKDGVGDTMEDAVRIAHEYGVIYKKSDGETGRYKPTFKQIR